MLRISEIQVQNLTKSVVSDYVLRVHSHIRHKYPKRTSQLSTKNLDDLIHLALARGPVYQLETEHAIARLAELFLLYGPQITDSTEPSQILHSHALDQETKLDLIFHALEQRQIRICDSYGQP